MLLLYDKKVRKTENTVFIHVIPLSLILFSTVRFFTLSHLFSLESALVNHYLLAKVNNFFKHAKLQKQNRNL